MPSLTVPANMPVADDQESTASDAKQHRRLVLCFDGTANKFQANRSDTNIVKIYQMLERNTMDQFHYYQPGIGTYSADANEEAGSIRFFPKTRAWINSTLDEMLGISFVDHVLGGYRFVMRYYEPGDDIYIFGFSRGAYTARFLAEMLHNIGLLSRGNEEMVYFAWDTFSKFQRTCGNVPQSAKDAELAEYMRQFKRTFSRRHVHVHFLGMFDCVNSVGQFEIPLFRKSYQYMTTPAAVHVRHAVSIHERRFKFKPALCLFKNTTRKDLETDLKEVWFAGNHGDVGGGWDPEKGQKYMFSDTPLNWMVTEMLSPKVQGLGGQLAVIPDDVKKHETGAEGYKNPSETESKGKQIRTHDMLKYGRGAASYMTFLWWILELFPISSRLELEHNKWVPRYWPPNLGSNRDIPSGSNIHSSVGEMLHSGLLHQSQAPVIGGSNTSFWQDLLQLLHRRKAPAPPRGSSDSETALPVNGTATS